MSKTATENADFLERVYKAIWKECGASDEHASIMARAISAGDRNGKMGQGMAVFEIPFFMWEHDMLDIEAEPAVVEDGKSFCVVDGNRGSGQWACDLAMEKAIEKAKGNTIGITWVRNLNDAGFLAGYVRKVLDHDMVGLGTVNTVPLTAPYGGREATVSAAPFTMVCPGGSEKPIIFDSAVCEAYDYDMVMAAEDDRLMPKKLLIDPETGELTDNPKPFVEQPYDRISAISSPTAFSSPKLYGFNIFTEVLTGLLTPGGKHVNQLPYPASEYEEGDAPTSVGGGFFMAINIKDLMPLTAFRAQAESFIRSVKATQPAPGFDQVYLPGERGLAKEDAIAETGVTFRLSAWQKLIDNAGKVGLDIEDLR